jgi:hypothetical protein
MPVPALDSLSYATASNDAFIRLAPVGTGGNMAVLTASSGAVERLPAGLAAALDLWGPQNPLVALTPGASPLPIYRYPAGGGTLAGWTWVFGTVSDSFAGVVALNSDGDYTRLAGGDVAPARRARDGTGPDATFEAPSVLALAPDGSAAFLDDAGAIRRLDTATRRVATLLSVAAAKAHFAELGSSSGSYGFYGWSALDIREGWLYAVASMSTTYCQARCRPFPCRPTDSNLGRLRRLPVDCRLSELSELLPELSGS